MIRDSIMMGADYYKPKRNRDVPIGIGRNCQIESAILDKNVQIGEGVVITSFRATVRIAIMSCILCAMALWSLPRIRSFPRAPASSRNSRG